MIADILTVMWKERKGLLRQRGSRKRAILTMLVPVAVIVIYFPWSMGANWVESYWSLLAAVIIPAIVVGLTIPDSIAGERERHTLETLLASRLSDRAILFGKLAMAVVYGWGMALLALVLSLLPLNIAHWDGHVMLYSPGIAFTNILFALLVATSMAGLGVLFSLRAATAQEAQQTLMAATMFAPLVLGVVATVLIGVYPGWGASVSEAIAAVGSTQIVLIVAAVLVADCVVLLRAAMNRFRRARLIGG